MLSSADLFQLVRIVGQSFFSMIFSQNAPFFWLVVILVALQYRKMQKSKEAWFGISREPVWPYTAAAVVTGLAGGLAGSFLMVFVGIDLADIGIIWLWPIAILLMLIHPRFLCFSYAGGLVSLSSLLFGFPRVNVPQLMALVALLHMIEALLIFISGHMGAIPVYTKNKKGQVVGAFNLQKLWPIPIVALTVINVHPNLGGTAIHMPDWWPLIRPEGTVNPNQLTYGVLPVMAALGYGDLAVTSRPQEKSRKSSVFLFGFSFVLISLAVISSYYREAALLAALFSPLGHELVIWLGQRKELTGNPLYIQPDRGVLVLDVLRGTPAGKLGLKSGDTILNINGTVVNSKYDLSSVLQEYGGFVEVEWLSCPSNTYQRNSIQKPLRMSFGMIPAPGPWDYPMVEYLRTGFFIRWIRRKISR